MDCIIIDNAFKFKFKNMLRHLNLEEHPNSKRIYNILNQKGKNYKLYIRRYIINLIVNFVIWTCILKIIIGGVN